VSFIIFLIITPIMLSLLPRFIYLFHKSGAHPAGGPGGRLPLGFGSEP